MTGFIQVPPQSTGKKVGTESRTLLTYDQRTGSFSIGNIITGAISGATGTIVGIQTEGFASNAGELYIAGNVGTWQDNEDIEVLSVSQAKVDISTVAQQTFDLQKVVIVDRDNLERTQAVDRFGATVNTFSEGAPTFGSFGSINVGEAQTIKDYNFIYDDLPGSFYDQTVGNGTITFDSDQGLSVLTTTSATTDQAKRTSHYYHPYVPGHGHKVMITAQCGDTGKTNLTRRWGYYDSDDGFFFELDDTTLYTVVRSSITGTPVDTKVAQADWNKDKLDGTDAIDFNLDVTKANIYWMDFQWLGAGTVRYGVYEPGGSRIVAHVVENANTNMDLPYTRTATLPVRYEQINSGSVVSTSQLNVNCISVQHSNRTLVSGNKHTEDSGIRTITADSDEVPIIALRPRTTFKGATNRTIWKGISYTISNITNSGGSPVVFRIRTGFDNALTNEAFLAHDSALSSTEFDINASSINTALTHKVLTQYVEADKSLFSQDLAPKELHTFENYLQADGTSQPCFIITAQCLRDSSADVWCGVNWEELIY